MTMRALPILALLLAAPAAAQGVLDLPLTGRVMDGAGVLAEATEASLTTLLEAHEAATTNQVVVLTVPGLEGYPVEDVANQLYNRWGLGQSDRDNGVLLLVARDDRELRIEVGYGLEGALTDAEAGRIIRNVIVPRFREGDFDGGVTAGVVEILAELDGDAALAAVPAGTVSYHRGLDGGDYLGLTFALLALLVALWLVRGYVVNAGRFWTARRRFSFAWRTVVGGLGLGFALYFGAYLLRTLTPFGHWEWWPAWPLGLLLWPAATGAVELFVRQSPVWQRYRRRQARVEKLKQRARQQGKRVLIWQWGRSFWYDGTPPAPSTYSGSSSGSSSSYSSSYSSSSSSYSSSSSFSGGGGSSGGGGASGSW